MFTVVAVAGVDATCLLGGLLEVSNEVSTVFLLLETSKDHLGTWDELLWVGEVGVECLLVPSDALVDVCLSVRVPCCLSSLTPNEAVQVWSSLVWSTLSMGQSG